MKTIPQKLLQLFIIVAVATGVVYVTDTVTRSIVASQFKTYDYLKGRLTDRTAIKCPQFVKVEGTAGAIIIKDECTNLYWNRVDLPIKNISDQPVGYTWSEAKQFCEGLATATGIVGPIFRLPTADELLSVVDTPCLNEGQCSQFIVPNATFADGTRILPGSGGDSVFYTGTFDGNKIFADGNYWTADEVDIDNNLGNGFEASSSVNLRYGTVNNPVFGKNVRLNVRCIYNNLLANEIPQVGRFCANDGSRPCLTNQDCGGATCTLATEKTAFDINEVQWSAAQDCSGVDAYGKKLKLTIRKNIRPSLDFSRDVNKCPLGIDDALTGEFDLCSGVSEFTNQCVFFGCAPGKYLQRKNNFVLNETPLRCKP